MRTRTRRCVKFMLVFVLVPAPWAVAQQSQNSTVRTSTELLDNGQLLLKVENRSSLPITAIAAVGTRTPETAGGHPGTSVRYFDSVLNAETFKQLDPYQTYTFRFFGAKPADVKKEATLKAVLFYDGSSYGDSEWVSKLIGMRKSALANLQDAIQMLKSAQASGETKEQLLQDAENRRRSKMAAAKDMEEKLASDIYQEVSWNFKADNTPFTQQIERLVSRCYAREQMLLQSKPPLNLSEQGLNTGYPY
jgi:hypothetical protein